MVLLYSTLDNINHNFGTLESAAFPVGHRSVTAKWVYSWKANQLAGRQYPREGASGGPGFIQREKLDYLDKFSPTPVPSPVLIATTTALQQDWNLNHWDIEQAFMHFRSDRENFVRFSEGCRSMSGKVVRLKKALLLYG